MSSHSVKYIHSRVAPSMRSCFGIQHLNFDVVYNRLDKLTSTSVAWWSYSWTHSSTRDASEPAGVYSLVCHGCFQVIHDRICFILIIVCLKGGVKAGLVATAYALVAAYELHVLKRKHWVLKQHVISLACQLACRILFA